MVSAWGSVSAGWTELHISQMAQGTATNQFIGNECRIKAFYFYGYLSLGANYTTGDDATNLFRIVVALWHQSATATPLQAVGATLNSQINKLQYPHGIIKKYYDRTFNIEARNNDYDGVGYVPHRIKVKWRKVWKGRGLRIRLQNNGQIENRLVCSMSSDSSAITHPGFVSGHMVVQWYDL